MYSTEHKSNIIHALEVSGISKSYGKKRVLSEASLIAEKGKVTGIVGENGSGKTTLLKIIIGLLSPDEGKINTAGVVGYCPQEMTVFKSLSVRENFKYFAAAYGIRDESGWLRNVNNLAERFSIGQYMEVPVMKLSGGTQQKLNLCIALMHDPDLIILDEPYSAFDWQSYLLFWELVAELKKEGKSFLIVSHIIYDRSALDKIYELKNKKLKCG